MDIIDFIARESNSDGPHYIGLVQSDVAYYFYNGNHSLYPTPHSDRERVVALAKAFPEKLFIYSEGFGDDWTRDYRKHLAEWDTLFIGSLGSGTLITASNVLPMLGGTLVQPASSGVRIDPISWQEVMHRQSQDEIRLAPGAWGAVSVAAAIPDGIRDRLESGAGSLVSMTEAQKRHLVNAFSNFYSASEESHRFRGSTVTCSVLEVPALLVGGKFLPKEIAEGTVAYFNRLDSEELRYRQEPLIADRPDNDLLTVLASYRGARLDQKILKSHRSVAQLRDLGCRYEIWVIVLSASLFLALAFRAVRQLRNRGALLDVSPFLTGPMAIAFCVCWLHLCLLVVTKLEYHHFMRYGTDEVSPFIEHDYSELLPKVTQHIASAFSSEELLPENKIAQLAWLSIPLMLAFSGFVGAVHIAMPPLLSYIKKNLKQGEAVKLENHFVICNWHPHAEDVVRQLRTQALMEGVDPPKILVITENIDSISIPQLDKRRDGSLGEYYLFAVPPTIEDGERSEQILEVLVIDGNPKNEISLKLGRIAQADTAIVFPDLALPEPDSPTALTVLKIQRLTGGDERPQVIVWCADSRNVDVFLDERFNLTDVCSTEWAWRVICQATKVPHVSNIYRRLMTSTEDTNEFYELKLPPDFSSCSFHDLQQSVHRYNLDCGAVSASTAHRNTVMLVGYIEGSDLQRTKIHINPRPDTVLHAGDLLLVLTYKINSEIQQKLLGCMCS